MTPDERQRFLMETENSVRQFAALIASRMAGSTGIPKPPEILVTETETETERFGLKLDPKDESSSASPGAPSSTTPPAGKALQIFVSGGCTDPTVPTYIHKSIAPSTFWLGFDVAFDAAMLTALEGSPCPSLETSPVFGAITAADSFSDCASGEGNKLVGPFMNHLHTNWQDDGYIGGAGFAASIPANTWLHFDLFASLIGADFDVEMWYGGVFKIGFSETFAGDPAPARILVGCTSYGAIPGTTTWIRNVKVGTTIGASDIFSEDFSGDLSAWSICGSPSIVADPFP